MPPWQSETARRRWQTGEGAAGIVRVLRPNEDLGRGAGFIPQEREHGTDAPAKFQGLPCLPTPLRTEVRAPSLARRPRQTHTGISPAARSVTHRLVMPARGRRHAAGRTPANREIVF